MTTISQLLVSGVWLALLAMAPAPAYAQGGPPGNQGATLGRLSCGAGEVAKFDGTAWVCAPDIDTNTDTDTLGNLICGDGEVAKFDGTAWVCAEDEAGTNLAGQLCPLGGVMTGVAGDGQACCRLVDVELDPCSPSTNDQGIDVSFCDLSNFVGPVNWAGGAAIGADLSGADLFDDSAPEPSLGSSNLGSMDFSYADLRGADLRAANLPGANFAFADLEGADLSGANVSLSSGWRCTVCPDGTNSATNGTSPQSCDGHLQLD